LVTLRPIRQLAAATHEANPLNTAQSEICEQCRRVIYLEQQIRVERERFKVVIENVSCGVMLLDVQANILYANRYVSDALGYTLQEITEHNAFYFTHPKETRLQRVLFGKTLDQPGQLRDRGYARFRSKRGVWMLFGIRALNLLDDPNVGVIIAFVNDESSQMSRYLSNGNDE